MMFTTFLGRRNVYECLLTRLFIDPLQRPLVTSLHHHLARLRELADGLTYSSEGDHPFEIVHVVDNSPQRELTPERVQELLALPPDVPVRRVSLERALGRHTVFTDPLDLEAGRLRSRYEAMGDFLERELGGALVFRTGHPPSITVWLLGRADNGDLVGYRTLATET
jgi:hypothetical protein